jgi:hypothetical protein
MKFTASLLFSASLLAATVLAAPFSSNAETALGHGNPIAGNADSLNSVARWRKEKRDAEPTEAEGNADFIDGVNRWGKEKRDASPHGTADNTLASGNADNQYNSYGWAR